MNMYELNGLGPDWYFPGNTAEEAQDDYLREIGKTLEEYIAYMEDIKLSPDLNWKLVSSD